MEEILIVEVIERKVVAKTLNDEYHGPLIKQLELILTQLGYERIHKSIFAKMDHVQSFDEKSMVIYFDEEHTLSCDVSRRSKDKVKNYLKIRHKAIFENDDLP